MSAWTKACRPVLDTFFCHESVCKCMGANLEQLWAVMSLTGAPGCTVNGHFQIFLAFTMFLGCFVRILFEIRGILCGVMVHFCLSAGLHALRIWDPSAWWTWWNHDTVVQTDVSLWQQPDGTTFLERIPISAQLQVGCFKSTVHSELLQYYFLRPWLPSLRGKMFSWMQMTGQNRCR